MLNFVSSADALFVGDISGPAVWARAISDIEKDYYVCKIVHPLKCETGMSLIDASRIAGAGVERGRLAW